MTRDRSRIIELIVAVSVVVISVASLFVAVFQGMVMQRTLEASVVPIMQYDTGNYNLANEDWVITLNFKNTGLGPAELRWIEMRWNNEPVSSLSTFIENCCLPEELDEAERRALVRQAIDERQVSLITIDVFGRFFAPQEDVNFITIARPDRETQPIGYDIWQSVDDVRHELEIEICYCSVFDDCWQARFPEQSREPVRQCPDPAATRD